MEIVWSPQSLEDIEIIGDWVAEDNPGRACTFIDEIINSTEQLISYPESGQLVEDNPVFRQLVHGGYRLIYQLRVGQILIITILAPGRNY
jgi:plasmid stabilization system protein ParE